MQYFRRFSFMIACLIGVTIGCEGPEPPNKNKRQIPAENFPEMSGAGPKKEGEVITTPSGLKYQDLREGSGRAAKNGDQLGVRYAGYLKDGKQFDSNLPAPNLLTLILGKGKVIKGWDEGLVGMKVGGERRLIIPPDLAYGERGSPPRIPENAELTFNIQLVNLH